MKVVFPFLLTLARHRCCLFLVVACCSSFLIARYVLLACGKPKVKAYAQLYTDMVHLARSNKGNLALSTSET